MMNILAFVRNKAKDLTVGALCKASIYYRRAWNGDIEGVWQRDILGSKNPNHQIKILLEPHMIELMSNSGKAKEIWGLATGWDDAHQKQFLYDGRVLSALGRGFEKDVYNHWEQFEDIKQAWGTLRDSGDPIWNYMLNIPDRDDQAKFFNAAFSALCNTQTVNTVWDFLTNGFENPAHQALILDKHNVRVASHFGKNAQEFLDSIKARAKTHINAPQANL